jgi:hypothetical protein
MQYELCRHVKTNGLQCKGAALAGGIWCYFQLTALEDRESVQVALSVIINALATGQLDIKRATALLYGLQLASNNARGLYTEPCAANTVRTIAPSPEGLDLAEPGPTLDTDDLYRTNEDEEEEEDDEDDEDNEGDEGDKDDKDDEEVQFTAEQPNRFVARSSPDPSPNQQPQNNSNPDLSNPDPISLPITLQDRSSPV